MLHQPENHDSFLCWDALLNIILHVLYLSYELSSYGKSVCCKKHRRKFNLLKLKTLYTI